MPAAQFEIPGSHARGSACPPPRFSVLALDGGGARGYLTAKILEQIEVELDCSSETPMPLGQRFDLIAGTSTGGIIALALAAGLPARTVSRLYTQFVPRIFSSAMRQPLWRRWTHARYRADGLHQALEAIFDGLTLADLRTDVCVTAVSLANAQPVILHSNYRDGGFPPVSAKLADLAMATAAAPTYFVASSCAHFTDLVDGGVCSNNPALLGVVEAFGFSRPSHRGVIPPRDIGILCAQHLAVLSVGTGEQPDSPFVSQTLRGGGTL
ncbi:MAG: patatin-like phospholipase family protein, partial [Thiomonas sp.]